MSNQIVTYLGATCVISGLGYGTKANYEALVAYKSGIKSVIIPELMPEPIMIQRISDDIFRIDLRKNLTRLEQLMVSAGSDVIETSGVERNERFGIIFSTTKGNISELQGADLQENSNVYLSVMAQNVAKALNINNEPIVVSNACISGVVAVNVAARLIRIGRYDNVLVVSGDEATPFVVSGFMGFKSVSKDICRPYDAQRDGLSMGEAVSALLVTKDVQKSSGIVIEGGSVTNDANHISGPSRTGEPLALAIKQTLDESGLKPQDISFINAHGTATIYNDEMESKAIALAGMSTTPLNSLKPYFGHTLGASGTIEIALCAEQMKHSMLIGTKGFETLGTPQPLNVSACHRQADLNHCLKIASGFGGCNVALVLSKTENAKLCSQYDKIEKFKCHRSCTISEGQLILDKKILVNGTSNFDDFIREAYHMLNEPNMKFFKMDDMCKLGYIGARYLLRDLNYDPTEIALILSNRSSSLDTDVRHQQIIDKGEPASPAVFVYTLANIVTGEIAISNKIHGETTFFISEQYNDKEIMQYAKLLLSLGRYKSVVVGWCDFFNKKYKLELNYITK